MAKGDHKGKGVIRKFFSKFVKEKKVKSKAGDGGSSGGAGCTDPGLPPASHQEPARPARRGTNLPVQQQLLENDWPLRSKSTRQSGAAPSTDHSSSIKTSKSQEDISRRWKDLRYSESGTSPRHSQPLKEALGNLSNQQRRSEIYADGATNERRGPIRQRTPSERQRDATIANTEVHQRQTSESKCDPPPVVAAIGDIWTLRDPSSGPKVLTRQSSNTSGQSTSTHQSPSHVHAMSVYGQRDTYDHISERLTKGQTRLYKNTNSRPKSVTTTNPPGQSIQPPPQAPQAPQASEPNLTTNHSSPSHSRSSLAQPMPLLPSTARVRHPLQTSAPQLATRDGQLSLQPPIPKFSPRKNHPPQSPTKVANHVEASPDTSNRSVPLLERAVPTHSEIKNNKTSEVCASRITIPPGLENRRPPMHLPFSSQPSLSIVTQEPCSCVLSQRIISQPFSPQSHDSEMKDQSYPSDLTQLHQLDQSSHFHIQSNDSFLPHNQKAVPRIIERQTPTGVSNAIPVSNSQNPSMVASYQALHNQGGQYAVPKPNVHVLPIQPDIPIPQTTDQERLRNARTHVKTSPTQSVRPAELHQTVVRPVNVCPADARQSDLRPANVRQVDVRQTDTRQVNTCSGIVRQTDVLQPEAPQADPCQNHERQSAVSKTNARQPDVRQAGVCQAGPRQKNVLHSEARKFDAFQTNARPVIVSPAEERQSDVRPANARLVDVRQAGVCQADVRPMGVRHSDSCQTDVRLVDACQADSRQADVRQADVRQANLQQIDVRQADIHQTDVRQADVRQSNASQADIGQSNVRRLDDVLQVDVRQADVRQANCRQTDIRLADVHPADVRPSDVRPSDVRQDDVRPADVRPSDVRQADVRPMRIQSAQQELPANASAENKSIDSETSTSEDEHLCQQIIHYHLTLQNCDGVNIHVNNPDNFSMGTQHIESDAVKRLSWVQHGDDAASLFIGDCEFIPEVSDSSPREIVKDDLRGQPSLDVPKLDSKGCDSLQSPLNNCSTQSDYHNQIQHSVFSASNSNLESSPVVTTPSTPRTNAPQSDSPSAGTPLPHAGHSQDDLSSQTLDISQTQNSNVCADSSTQTTNTLDRRNRPPPAPPAQTVATVATVRPVAQVQPCQRPRQPAPPTAVVPRVAPLTFHHVNNIRWSAGSVSSLASADVQSFSDVSSIANLDDAFFTEEGGTMGSNPSGGSVLTVSLVAEDGAPTRRARRSPSDERHVEQNPVLDAQVAGREAAAEFIRTRTENADTVPALFRSLAASLARVPGVLMTGGRRGRLAVYLSRDRPNVEGVVRFMVQNHVHRQLYDIDILPRRFGREAAGQGSVRARQASAHRAAAASR